MDILWKFILYTLLIKVFKEAVENWTPNSVNFFDECN